MDVKRIFSKEITTKPFTIQFAKDRKYEEAWIINLDSPRPSDIDIDNYLNDKFDLLIVEYIWYESKNTSPFVLTIFLDENCKLQNRIQFVKTCLALFYNYENFNSFISKYNNQIVGHDALLSSPIQGIRLGIFNYWMSIGPIDLWNKGEKIDFDIINRKIHDRPEIETSNLNFQSLLFTFNGNEKLDYPFHGIKTPSSKNLSGIWKVDYEQINDWISKLLIK